MRDWISETAIAVSLLAAIGASVAIVIVSGPKALPATHLPDLAILLGGALAGVSLPKRGGDPPS